MAAFYHPYQFIPVKNKATDKVDYEQIKNGDSGKPIRHDYWEKDAYHGRLICKLHLVTPTVVGGQHKQFDDDNAKEVEPYRCGDEIAIPGNSLRGMIGSVVETLSQSALRILEDKKYSVRKPMGESLAAIGMLKKPKDPNAPHQFEIIPLTVPTLKKTTPAWLNLFKNGEIALKDCLPAYVKGYYASKRGKETTLKKQANSFLERHNPNCFQGAKEPEYFYARLSGTEQTLNDKLEHSHSRLFPFAQKAEDVLTASEWQALPANKKTNYTKGIMRVLGIDGRETEIPETKKNEIFLPAKAMQRIPVPKAVVERFKALIKERYEDKDESLPFLPQGYDKPEKYEDWQLKSGQLVFFDIDANGEITEISFSSIWRKAVEGSAYDFFGDIDKDFLPWGAKPKDDKQYRTQLTPSEYLFGTVEAEENKPKESGEKSGFTRSLASRVRFSDAHSLEQVKLLYSEPQLLKILSSPKTPSPSMYFHPKNPDAERFVAKTQLDCKHHLPNGRKVYLHHQSNDVVKKPWESRNQDNLKQKMRCNPMAEGQDFYFHIDFDNLSEAELDLLLSSLSPQKDFLHRLGLGKSLGLGSIKITIEGLFLINRAERYAVDAWDKPRYQQVWCDTEYKNKLFPKWHKLYPQEVTALKSDGEKGKFSEFKQNHHCAELIDAATLKILTLVGNPAALKDHVSVLPPLLVGQNAEEETFEWFVKNEENKGKNEGFGHQALLEIKPDDTTLKPLQQLKE